MAEEKSNEAECLEHWNGWWEVESRKDWDKLLDFYEISAEKREEKTKSLERCRYQMTKDNFSILSCMPSEGGESDHSASMDWKWQEPEMCRHRWTKFPHTYETEFRPVKGKSVRYVRELVSATEMKLVVTVLEGEGDNRKVVVGPCISKLCKDGAVVGSMKMKANKGVGFYLKVAQGLLKGMPVSGGSWRRPLPIVQLEARGNAINDAGGVAAALVSKGIGIIGSVQTSQLTINGANVAEISIRMISKDIGILPLVAVSGYSVLGAKMGMDGQMATVAPEPAADTAFVDPAGLPYIKNGPSGAAGAAGVIYGFLGIKNAPAFPDPVVAAIHKPLDAKFHAYGEKKCVHVVGPDFRGKNLSRDDAVGELAKAYQNILVEFVASGLPKLRMLPVSGGIFCGNFMPELPGMTAEALQKGFSALTAEQQQHVLCASELVMCIFMEKELKDFAQAFAERRCV